MCINKQDSKKFWIKQVFQNASITQPTKYARMCLDRVLDFEYGRVLNMQESHRVLNMPQYG